MPREMLKLRKGDSAIMIKADGSIELAGVQDKPIIDANGRLSPIILFAAAWAKKDQATMNALLTNFKATVREGYFGQDAKTDFEAMEKRAASAATTMQQSASGAVTTTKKGIEIESNATEEEMRKAEEETRRLNELRKEAEDPRLKRQMEAMKQGAEAVKSEPMTKHLLPDLPVEQTMKYQKATPEEQEKMRNAASGAVTLEPVVGSATIEEGVDNEDK